MRISRSRAKEIAQEVTKPLGDKVNAANQNLSDKTTAIIASKIPRDVMTFFKKHPGYFKKENYIRFSGPGIVNYLYANLNTHMPLTTTYVQVTAEDAKALVKLNDAVEDAKTARRESILRIENAILTLGTPAKVKASIPELEKFFPATTTTTIALPPTQIRKEIKKLVGA